MIWLTDEERKRNKEEEPARRRRASAMYNRVRNSATNCPACDSIDISFSGLSEYSDESSVKLQTEATCGDCGCTWYPGRAL